MCEPRSGRRASNPLCICQLRWITKWSAVFNIAFTRPDFIPEDTVRVFSALVNRAAISIANMELFEQTKDLAVMEERNRLARDLHDSAKQKAFAALAQLGTARGILNGHGNGVTMHLERSRESGDRCDPGVNVPRAGDLSLRASGKGTGHHPARTYLSNGRTATIRSSS